MSKIAKNKKYLNLDGVRVSYNHKTDTIHLTSTDKDLSAEGFHLTLNKQSESEQALRNLLMEKGLIRPSQATESIASTVSRTITNSNKVIPKTVIGEFDPATPTHLITLGESADGLLSWNVDIFPHLLAVGAPGTGKSVLIRRLFNHCLTHNNDWEFVGIDLSHVEMRPYSKYERTTRTIATTLEQTVVTLEAIRDVIDMRYSEMEEEEVSNFNDLNLKRRRILVTLNSDTILSNRLEKESPDESESLDRIRQVLQKIVVYGRAAGVHLALTSQGALSQSLANILRNIDVKIAFRLGSYEDMIFMRTDTEENRSLKSGEAIVFKAGKKERIKVAFNSPLAAEEWVLGSGKLYEPMLHSKLEKREKDIAKVSAEPQRSIPEVGESTIGFTRSSHLINLGTSAHGPMIWDTKTNHHMLASGGTGKGLSALVDNLFTHCLSHNDKWDFYGLDVYGSLNKYEDFSQTTKTIVSGYDKQESVITELKEEILTRQKNKTLTGKNTPKSILCVIENAFSGREYAPEADFYRVKDLHEIASLHKQLEAILPMAEEVGVHFVIVTKDIKNEVFSNQFKSHFDTRVIVSSLPASSVPLVLGETSQRATELPVGRALLKANNETVEFQLGYTSMEAKEKWVLEHGKDMEPELYKELTSDTDEIAVK
jgi:hypothetical protein